MRERCHDGSPDQRAMVIVRCLLIQLDKKTISNERFTHVKLNVGGASGSETENVSISVLSVLTGG